MEDLVAQLVEHDTFACFKQHKSALVEMLKVEPP